MSDPHSISILWPATVAAVIGLGTFVVHKIRGASRPSAGDNAGPARLNMDIDRWTCIRSPVHSWDPRVKIVSLMIYMFGVGALTSLGWAAAALMVSVLTAVLARIPWPSLGKRLVMVAGFLGMFFVVMPLTVKALPGDTLFSIEGLEFIRINPRGLKVAALVLLKASAIVVMTAPLLETSTFPTTVSSLASLRVPPIMVQMILMCYRYLFVFAGEMQRMATAMKARGFRKRTDLQTLRIIADFVGVLLLRSFERTERVYEAMLSRGYTGQIRRLERPAPAAKDYRMAAIWVGCAAALIVLDRLFPLVAG